MSVSNGHSAAHAVPAAVNKSLPTLEKLAENLPVIVYLLTMSFYAELQSK